MLAALDIGGLYRVLGAEAGISQRQIAALAGQSQSVHFGRRVATTCTGPDSAGRSSCAKWARCPGGVWVSSSSN